MIWACHKVIRYCHKSCKVQCKERKRQEDREGDERIISLNAFSDNLSRAKDRERCRELVVASTQWCPYGGLDQCQTQGMRSSDSGNEKCQTQGRRSVRLRE